MTLKLQQVRMQLKDFQFGPINCEIHSGIVGIVGPNGAGKTTFLSIIGGIYSCHEGAVFLGKSSAPASAYERRLRVSSAGLSDIWYDELTLQQHLPLYRSTCPGWDEELCRQWMDKMSVPGSKKLKSLSAGTRTKAALSIAIARKAPIIALDEPWNTLDPIGRRQLSAFLVEIGSSVGSESVILVSSHELDRLEDVADSLIFIRDGQMLFEGTWEEAREFAGQPLSASSADMYERLLEVQ